MVRTTSTSFISGTGLKKCSPINRSGRLVAVISSVMEMDEVFEAKMASFFTMPSSDAYIFFFSSTFSMMASIMMSQSARSCLLVVPLSRARMALLRFFDRRLSPAALGKLRQRFFDSGKAFVEKFCSTSRTVTSNLQWLRPERCRAHQATTENANFFYFHKILY